MENYEINDKTLALYALNNKTRVYETDNTFIVNKDTYTIMEESCGYYGSSLMGRKKGTENLIGNVYRAPIIVEESQELIFFPTTSYNNKNCTWLKFNEVDRYYYKGSRLIVELKNGSKIVLDTTYGVIDNQILRSSRLESVLRDRKKTKNLSK